MGKWAFDIAMNYQMTWFYKEFSDHYPLSISLIFNDLWAFSIL